MKPTGLVFPCSFPIKVIGKDTDGFQATVTEVIRHHVPELRDTDVTVRSSASGHYLSLTATFVAMSREQLDALYRELGTHELVLMLL